MAPFRRVGSVGVCALACLCALALCASRSDAANSRMSRGRAFYDEPDYDMGLGDSVPLPNQQSYSGSRLRDARRSHRTSEADGFRFRSRRDDVAQAGEEEEEDQMQHTLPSLTTSSARSAMRNMRFRSPMPELARSIRFRDRSRAAHERGPVSSSFMERGASASAASSGMNTFYGRAPSMVSDSQASAMDIDDPFGGPAVMGQSYTTVPTQTQRLPTNQPFEAPAFTEVVSQIKEIVTHPRSASEGLGGMHHIIGSVVPEPSVAPPMAPPPVPTAFRNGPPIPSSSSLLQLRASSRAGPPPTTSTHLTTNNRPRAVVTNVEPVLLEDPSNSYPPVPKARSQSNARSPSQSGPKPRFLIETEEQVQANKVAENRAQAEREALDRKLNPRTIPFLEHDSRSQAHSFIEELAGVHQTAAAKTRHVASLPPPLVVARTEQNPHHVFRHWD